MYRKEQDQTFGDLKTLIKVKKNTFTSENIKKRMILS
jgi:hypothetical protein